MPPGFDKDEVCLYLILFIVLSPSSVKMSYLSVSYSSFCFGMIYLRKGSTENFQCHLKPGSSSLISKC